MSVRKTCALSAILLAALMLPFPSRAAVQLFEIVNDTSTAAKDAHLDFTAAVTLTLQQNAGGCLFEPEISASGTTVVLDWTSDGDCVFPLIDSFRICIESERGANLIGGVWTNVANPDPPGFAPIATFLEHPDDAGDCAPPLPFSDQLQVSATVPAASDVAAADLDGDGTRGEIVSASISSDEVAWHARSGPLWVKNVITTTGLDPASVHTADLDDDRQVDILVGFSGDGTIAWYENDAGSFTERVIDTALVGLTAVHSGDLDGDGARDVVAGFGDTIVWYRNLGGTPASFDLAQAITTSATSVAALVTADLDRSGTVEVIGAADDLIGWYRGSGSSWTMTPISTLAPGASAVAIGDIDHNGWPDVVAASAGDDSIRWYANVSPGLFNLGVSITSTAQGVSDVAVRDVDLDGRVDVLATSETDNTIAVHLNLDGGAVWGDEALSTADSSAVALAVVDFDRDGDVDVVTASATGLLEHIGLYENQMVHRSARFFCENDLTWRHVVAALGGAVQDVAAGDFNRDGSLDVAVATEFTVQRVLNTGGAISWSPQETVLNAFGITDIMTTDVNGDGNLDVLAASGSVDSVSWAPGNGNGSFGSRVILPGTTGNATSVFAADIDDDGDTDALSTADAIVEWHENLGGGATWTTHSIQTMGADGAASVVADYLDADGKLDVAAVNENDINWFSQQDPPMVGDPPDWDQDELILDAILGDYTSIVTGNVVTDGAVDLLHANAKDPDHESLDYWSGESFAPSQTFMQCPKPTISTDLTCLRLPQSVVAADLDLDGDDDALASGLLDPRAVVFPPPPPLPGSWAVAWFDNGIDEAMGLGARFGCDAADPDCPDTTSPIVDTDGPGATAPSPAVVAADMDNDGDPDALYGYLSLAAWCENRGGQCAMPTAAIPLALVGGALEPALRIDVKHRGRGADARIQPRSFAVGFADVIGAPLTTAQLLLSVEMIEVWADRNISGEFEEAADLMLKGEVPNLVDGIQVLEIPDLESIAPHSKRTYFIVLKIDPFPILPVSVRHLVDKSRCEDVGGHPLTIEGAKVPEPAMLPALVGGVLLLVGLARRRTVVAAVPDQPVCPRPTSAYEKRR